MALAWKAGWVNALRGSNPLSSANGMRLHPVEGWGRSSLLGGMEAFSGSSIRADAAQRKVAP